MKKVRTPEEIIKEYERKRQEARLRIYLKAKELARKNK